MTIAARPAWRARFGGTVAVVGAALVIALAACSGPGAGSPTSSPADVVSPVTGVLTHIDAAGLTRVTGFRLRIADGRELAFTIGVLENGTSFPPGHLAEHFQALSPIRVFFRRDAGSLVVYRIEDAAG